MEGVGKTYQQPTDASPSPPSETCAQAPKASTKAYPHHWLLALCATPTSNPPDPEGSIPAQGTYATESGTLPAPRGQVRNTRDVRVCERVGRVVSVGFLLSVYHLCFSK